MALRGSGSSAPTSGYRGDPFAAPPGFGPQSNQSCVKPDFQSYFEGGPIFKITAAEMATGAPDQLNVLVPLRGRTISIYTGGATVNVGPSRLPGMVYHFRQFDQSEFMDYSMASSLVADPLGVGIISLPPGIFFEPGQISGYFATYEESFDQFYVSWRSAQGTGAAIFGDIAFQVFDCPASRIL